MRIPLETKTLGKIAVGLLFPVAGIGYLYRHRISSNLDRKLNSSILI